MRNEIFLTNFYDDDDDDDNNDDDNIQVLLWFKLWNIFDTLTMTVVLKLTDMITIVTMMLIFQRW